MVYVQRPEQKRSPSLVRSRCTWQESSSLLSWWRSEMRLAAVIPLHSLTVSTRSPNLSLKIPTLRHVSTDSAECWKPLSHHLFVWKGSQLHESDVDNLKPLAFPTSYRTLASIAEIKLLS